MASALRKQQMVTGLLLAAVVGLGGYYVATSHQLTTKEIDSRKTSLFKLYRADDLTEVLFERDGQKYRLHRKLEVPDGGEARLWHVEENGKDGLADQFAVDKALSTLEYAFPVRRIEAGEINRQAFGLTDSRLRMTLVMGKLKTTLQVGGPAPKPEGTLYADVDGEISVVKKDGLSPVDVPADAFRTRTVVPYLSTDLAGITLTVDGKTSTLSRGPGTTWKLDGGAVTGRIDRFVFDRALSSLADIKADHFLPDGTAAKEEVRLVMTPTDTAKPKGELVLGGECPGHPDETVVVRKLPTPLIVCAGKGVLEGLRLAPEQLADRRAFSVREDEVEELTMEEGGKKLELARKGAGFHQRAPVDADVAGELVKSLLKALTGTRADAPPTSGPPPDEVRTKITIKPVGSPDGERPAEVVEIGPPDKDGRVRVKRLQDGQVIVLSRDEARPFSLREAALRSPKVLDLPLDKVTRITLTREDGVHTLERSDTGNWSIGAPKGMPIDLGVANAISETCVHLTADQWVADRDDGTFGLKKPRLTFDVVVKDGETTKTHHVELGDQTNIGTYGRVSGQEGVFLVPRAVENQLQAWAIDLTTTTVDPSDVTRLTLTRKGAPPLTLIATKDGWKPESGELPPSRLAALREALHELRAEAVVHLGGARKGESLDAPQLELKGTRPAGASTKELRIVIGAGDAFRGSNVFYAQRDGVDVVYAIPSGRVRALLGLL